MSIQISEGNSSRLEKSTQIAFQKHFHSLDQIRNVQMDLMTNVQSEEFTAPTSSGNKWLFNLKIKHQVLLLTIILIMIVGSMSIAINLIHVQIFATVLANGFDQILHRETQNFQAAIMIKYMSTTRNYIYNDQQLLLTINQMYNHALKQEYSIDLGVECPVANEDENYPSYSSLPLFCYAPQGASDLQTFDNSTLNTEFVKFTNILNQFILCFGFPQEFKMNSAIYINLDNEEEMGSYYPQNQALEGYLPRSRPFFSFQKQEYLNNITKDFHISKYFKWYDNTNTKYGQTLTVSLLNGTEFHGVLTVAIQFSVFYSILHKFPDVNLAIISLDGTVLFEQTQHQVYNQEQFIFNQSASGYNYLDWLNLQQHKNYTEQSLMNNTLFPEPINVNIKKFSDLPYYFIVYNNLTYENQVKTIQSEILHKINYTYRWAVLFFMFIFIVILIVCYFIIEGILKPLKTINNLILHHQDKFKSSNQTCSEESKNILDILTQIITLKYSELENLSFKKSVQCLQIENITLPIKTTLNLDRKILRYLQISFKRIQNYIIWQ